MILGIHYCVLIRSKTDMNRRWIFIILAVTGFMRVAIIAVPVVGLYLYGDRTYEEVREK